MDSFEAVERAAGHYYHSEQQLGIDNRTKALVMERLVPHLQGPAVLELGFVDGMFTDAKALLKGGLDLVVSAWKEAKGEFDWTGMDRYVTHQVSSVHTGAIVRAAKLDRDRVPVTYPELGNVGPASIPITLAAEQKTLRRGDRVLLMGVGSGLNTGMLELAW